MDFSLQSTECKLPAWVESLFVLKELACLQFLLKHCLFLLCELAPIFLALFAPQVKTKNNCQETLVFVHIFVVVSSAVYILQKITEFRNADYSSTLDGIHSNSLKKA